MFTSLNRVPIGKFNGVRKRNTILDPSPCFFTPLNKCFRCDLPFLTTYLTGQAGEALGILQKDLELSGSTLELREEKVAKELFKQCV